MLLRHRNFINAATALRSGRSNTNSSGASAAAAAASGARLESTCANLMENTATESASTSTSRSTSRRNDYHQTQIIRHQSTVASASTSALAPSSALRSWKNHPCHQQQYQQQQQQQLPTQLQLRFLSTKNDSNNGDHASTEEQQSPPKEKETLEETVHRLKNEGDDTSSSTPPKDGTSSDDILRDLATKVSSFRESLSDTWNELLNSNDPKDVNKKIHEHHVSKPGNASEDDNEAADKYEGTTAVMIIDEAENLNAYERIQRRLSEAPLIQDIFRKAEEVYEKSGAAKAGEKISHIKEDAQEAWETSQNPWVYRASSVYDTITAESEFAMAERELRVLDPTFNLEDWKRGLVEVTLPNIMQLFLEGRIKELKPQLGEAVYNKLAAEARARKKEGVYIDTNILGIMNSDILACTQDIVNKGSPIITVHFMCQQINCVKKKETDEVVEGSEDDIRAYSYVLAMQREYDEEKGELNWKIMDFMVGGAMAYL